MRAYGGNVNRHDPRISITRLASPSSCISFSPNQIQSFKLLAYYFEDIALFSRDTVRQFSHGEPVFFKIEERFPQATATGS